jgi:lysozyme
MEDLEDMLTRHEGKKSKVYKCSAGYDTIGVGHNIDSKGLPEEIKDFLDKNGYITEDMIQELLADDIEDAINDAWRLYPDLESFTESRRNALIDFLFNVGYKTASTFKRTNNHINKGNWEQAAKCLLDSKYAKQVKGRANEIAKMLKEG